jgi:hypothetical protein
MLKRLAIFGMLLVVFCANSCADQVQAKQSNQKVATPVAVIPQQQHDGATLQGKEQKDVHADVKIVNPPQKDIYDKAPVWINFALVLVALGTGIVIGWQSFETRKAAEATRKSVELNASANTQWIRLKLLDMYSEAERNAPRPPPEITLNCRWIILNPSSQPLTLHWVKVGVARDDAWHVCEFDFEEVIAPGEDDKIAIVPIHLGREETAEYLERGVEYSISFGARFTGVNGKPSYQG